MMDAGHLAALQGSSPTKATLVRIDMPGAPICLTDGGFAVFDAGEGEGPETYFGEHPSYGVLDKVPSIRDGAEEQTTRVNIVLLPKSDVAVAALAQPSTQGARVQWWETLIDPATGGHIGQPELKFDGEMDRARFEVGESWSLTLECGSQAERAVEPNEDWRLNDAFHGLVWPGERGLAHVTNVTMKDEWRERPESPGLFKRLVKALVPVANL